MRHLLRRLPGPSRRPRSLWLLVFSTFGLGAAVGYAAGAQRSVLGLAFLAGLLLGLLGVERWLARRADRRRQDAAAEAPPARRPPSRPPESSFDLARDRSTRRQRYLM